LAFALTHLLINLRWQKGIVKTRTFLLLILPNLHSTVLHTHFCILFIPFRLLNSARSQPSGKKNVFYHSCLLWGKKNGSFARKSVPLRLQKRNISISVIFFIILSRHHMYGFRAHLISSLGVQHFRVSFLWCTKIWFILLVPLLVCFCWKIITFFQDLLLDFHQKHRKMYGLSRSLDSLNSSLRKHLYPDICFITNLVQTTKQGKSISYIDYAMEIACLFFMFTSFVTLNVQFSQRTNLLFGYNFCI